MADYDPEKLKKDVEQKLMPLDESSNFDEVLTRMRVAIQQDRLDRDENIITVEVVANAYKNYINWWQREFGSRNKDFISKEDRRKPIDEFIKRAMYNSKFKNVKDARFTYLFGDIPEKELEDSYGKFKKKTKR